MEKRNKKNKIRRYIVTGIALFIVFAPFVYIVVVYSECYTLLERENVYDPNLSTKIYDRNGGLISELFDENRSFISIERIPEQVKQAFITAEDKNFYKHTGIDLLGILRALIVDIFSGKIKQGGSTITQQLAKQLYTKGERQLKRKIIEVIIAGELERTYSKDQILEMYLNQVYFGHGVYGIQAASQYYFGHGTEKLGLIESTLLAGLPSSPSRFTPIRKPQAAYKRCSHILNNMIDAGHVSKADASRQFAEFWPPYLKEVKTRYHTGSIRNKKFDKAPYFTEYIRRILVKKYGEDTVYRKGLKVHTTLDLRYQDIARTVLAKKLAYQNSIAEKYNRYKLNNIDTWFARRAHKGRKVSRKQLKRYSGFLGKFRNSSIDDTRFISLLFDIPGIETTLENYRKKYEQLRKSALVEGALVALNPQSGGIRVMLGGNDFNSNNQLNRAVQSLRQPGSSFKAFVYGAGIESKIITPGSAFSDLPIIYKDRKKTWSPSNYEKSFQGTVLARKAFTSSLNTVSVIIYNMVGGERIAKFTSRLIGIPEKRFEIDPTLALGTTELSPLEMAKGFGVFANNGISVTPSSIRYINDKKGKRIYNRQKDKKYTKKRRIVSPETAFIMTNLMRGVVDYGTASGAIRSTAGFRLPAAGKTGTNSQFRDAWFVGFIPDLVASVWVGCDSQKFTLGPGQSGSLVAAPIWGEFMREVTKLDKPREFKGAPGSVSSQRICSKSGDIPAEGCPVKHEYFISGTGPSKTCEGHNRIKSIFDSVRKKKEQLLKKERNKSGETWTEVHDFD
ncbi:MAG: PBP1A family penicillin-binding protein [bacterium]|nr:PBP1A family penicillin-binding protein [bacterium]